ncbi:MAG: ATP-binding protein [Rhodothermales bacterium]
MLASDAAEGPRSHVLGFIGFRVGLILYAVFVPGFWVWYRPDLIGSIDPLAWRLGLSACASLVLAGTYTSRWVRRRIVSLFTGLLYLLAGWFFPLLALNRLHHDYVIGLLLIVVSSAFGLAVMGRWERRVERLLWYLGFVFAATLASAVLVPDPQIEGAQFVATVIVIIAMAYLCARVTTSVEAQLTHSEAAARASDERFRRVFENVHDVLFEVDDRGRLTLLSPAWVRITGFGVEESLGRSFFEFIFEDDKHETYDRTQALFHRGEEVYDEVVRVRTAQGEVRWVAVRARLTYGPAGVASGAAGTLANVTDSFRVQAEQKARERAEELLRLKTSFLNNMSHELRTPLTGILGFAEVLAEEVTGEQAEFAQLIQTSATRLLGTVNSVLDLAQLEGSGLSLSPETLDVAAEVSEAVRLLCPLAEQKGIALSTCGAEATLAADMDPHALHRIVTNLVGNAIKFTDRGSVVVHVESVLGRVLVVVEDTGIGIPEGVVHRMFEPFRQASEGLARKHEGNGLGLTITKQLVELMGGVITVESEVGLGTRFIVELPVAVGQGDGAGGDRLPESGYISATDLQATHLA